MAKVSLAKRRAARKNYAKVAKKSPAGAPGGPRSKALLASVEAGGARNPGAVIGTIGRKKYGAKKMGKWSGAGRHRAAMARKKSGK